MYGQTNRQTDRWMDERSDTTKLQIFCLFAQRNRVNTALVTGYNLVYDFEFGDFQEYFYYKNRDSK
jgi:hypothetical protein